MANINGTLDNRENNHADSMTSATAPFPAP